MNKKIALACSVCSSRNYNTTKNTRTKPERLEINKFCKLCSTHTMHKETK